MPKVLILYSNPSDTERIRLDKEHRAVDRVLETLKLPADTIIRRHGTTFEDFVGALAEEQYSVVQFSSHGSADGIYLEAGRHDGGELITATRIATLLTKAQPDLRLAIFMSCFSATALQDLVVAAPYILTVFGPADDEASIEFVRVFYKRYLKDERIERAFLFAQAITSDTLQTVLSRRALHENQPTVLFQVFPTGDHSGDSFLVDLSPAEQDIERLEVPREAFLSTLSRKIRLHHRIFDFPRERAILPIGQFFGIFSWQNSSDVVTCHRILRIKPEVDYLACDVWAWVAVYYNDHVIQKYRILQQPAAPHNAKVLTVALTDYRHFYHIISQADKYVTVLDKYVPEQYKLSRSMVLSNLDIAEDKLHQEDFASVVFYLECALSAEHDLLDALTAKLAFDS